MRNMSFAMTTDQILARTKTVTRRLGWLMLKPGDQVRAVKKCMGLRKGERIEPLAVLRIIDVRREPLRRMTDDLEYGFAEVDAEGFGHHPIYQWPPEFVEMFCASHQGCTPNALVTRIEFDYQGAGAQEIAAAIRARA